MAPTVGEDDLTQNLGENENLCIYAINSPIMTTGKHLYGHYQTTKLSISVTLPAAPESHLNITWKNRNYPFSLPQSSLPNSKRVNNPSL